MATPTVEVFCPFCSCPVPRGHKVCGTCGNGYLQPCGACGQYAAALAFCRQCGQALGSLGSRKNGAYRLIRQIGLGGMGRIYHAIDSKGRHVALKETLEDVRGNSKAVELFDREAMALKKLDHPAIPRLLDFFMEGDHRVQVLELVHGFTLDRLAREAGGRLSETQVVRWMLDLCDILDYLHGQGVIHRDVKPNNLLLRRSKPPLVLVDFGAVVELGESAGTCIATPGYTPFEQSQGVAVLQSDIYAVGATIIALVCGKRPDALYDTVKGTFVGLENLGMSPALARVVRHATAFIAAERPSSANSLKRALLAV
jgi:serine/threonine-protein kinase